MKRRAAEPSTEAEESGGGTGPKGNEPRPKETAGNEPRKRTERGKEVGSRGRELEETKAGAEGGQVRSDPEETKESGGRERQSGSHCEAEA